jgi:hypothetical protein
MAIPIVAVGRGETRVIFKQVSKSRTCHTCKVSLLQFAQQIESSHIGTAIRESMWAFPILNLVHLLGLIVAAGTIVYWDLRLLGLGLRRSAVSELGRQLLPWTWGGFGVMSVSGLLLAWSEAGRLYSNIFFRMKMLFLLLAGLNVLIFHSTVYRSVSTWDNAPITPLRARIAGALSLALWFGLIAAGRAIGYSLDYGV